MDEEYESWDGNMSDSNEGKTLRRKRKAVPEVAFIEDSSDELESPLGRKSDAAALNTASLKVSLRNSEKKKRSKDRYVQKYPKSWENEDMFKGWLANKQNENLAICLWCNAELTYKKEGTI